MPPPNASNIKRARERVTEGRRECSHSSAAIAKRFRFDSARAKIIISRAYVGQIGVAAFGACRRGRSESVGFVGAPRISKHMIMNNNKCALCEQILGKRCSLLTSFRMHGALGRRRGNVFVRALKCSSSHSLRSQQSPARPGSGENRTAAKDSAFTFPKIPPKGHRRTNSCSFRPFFLSLARARKMPKLQSEFFVSVSDGRMS